MQYGMQALASALPNAEYRPLNGQTHNVKAKAHAPLLSAFFCGQRASSTDDHARSPALRRELREQL
jgi:hypothetical protein